MKRLILLGLLFLAALTHLQAQRLELTPLAGYTFRDRLPMQGGEAAIEDGETYGGVLGYDVDDDFGVEFIYTRQLTRVTANSISIDRPVNEPATVAYYMIGGNRYATNASGTAKFFGGAKFGGATLSSRENRFDDVMKFAVGLNLGTKIYFSEKVGLRLAATLNFPLVNVGGSLWWSPSGGAQAGVSSYSPLLQFGLHGGLVLRLK